MGCDRDHSIVFRNIVAWIKNVEEYVIEIGSIVEVQINNVKKKTTYTIVGRTEASPETGLISNESPVGKSLLGRKAGETIDVQVPAGIQTVRILKVR